MNNKIDEISTLYRDAFIKDPLFNYVINKNHYKRVKKLFVFFTKLSLVSQQKVIEDRYNGVLRGVILLETPESINNDLKISRHISIIVSFINLLFSTSFSTINRLMKYMAILTPYRFKENHHYISCFGVSPLYQGQGVGKKLFLKALKIVDDQKSSIGVGLDTENPENVELYKKFGFEVTHEDRLGDITIYSMFRKKKKS